ncbi:MAG: 4-hydroxy-tetrahydrodipicolinate synthase [Candidatus Kapaibacterium sp.]|jgi:4-hydroxy-tetrahydrodipicolinate synthase
MEYIFKGTGTALSTPFNLDGSINFSSLGKLIDYQIDNGIECLVPCGSTGESATMNHNERIEVIKFTLEKARNYASHKPKVIAGTGSNITSQTIEFSLEAQELGVDGVLLVSPYYNKPNQNGLIAHFSAIANACSDLPIILYNVPGRTGGNITAETTLELASKFKNIVAIKEASADIEQCSKIIRDAPNGFGLLSGEDSLTVPLISLGGIGVIAVISNEAPKDFGDMVRCALANDFNHAKFLHHKLFDLMRTNFIETNPVPVKEALSMMGIFEEANFRLPLVQLSKTNRDILKTVLMELGLVN